MRKLENLINYLEDCKEAAGLEKEVKQYEERIAVLDASIEAFANDTEVIDCLCEIWDVVNRMYAIAKLKLAKINLRIAEFEMAQAFTD